MAINYVNGRCNHSPKIAAVFTGKTCLHEYKTWYFLAGTFFGGALVYINDLPEQVKLRVRLFADDTAMYLALSSHIEGQVLQNDLLSLEKWEKMWDMIFNSSKCQVLHVTHLKTPIETEYFLHDTMLDRVEPGRIGRRG